ncbi:MAG TPA: monovalent cation:proton antiporter-2 (CPA2) family protein [Acidiferrobacterales bacterium]
MAISPLYEAVLLLAAAVITVPLFRRLGLGAVLGYLAAGVAIGPWVFGWVRDVENILHFSELGVVLLLFIIGLELQPARLWALRRPVFGLGSAQVAVTGLLLMLPGWAAGLTPTTALVVGLVLSLSSTAFVLQILAEKKQLTTHHGRTSFAILLFQDLAAIPLLAVIPLLAAGAAGEAGGPWAALEAVAMVAVVIVVGRWLLRPFLRLVAATNIHELFTAAALLVVIGAALLMDRIGLSMALGAFLAGVLVADSEYRHELEADIEPFKGLLLGLYFIAVGMSVNLGLVAARPWTVLGLVAGLMLVKGIAVYAVSRIAGHAHGVAINTALYLPQGGEFAFVLLGVAAAAQVVERALADLLIVVVSLSMAATPLLIAANERLFRIGRRAPAEPAYDRVEPKERHVIIAGFGRFGQMVARTLRVKNIPFTALEASFEQVDFVRKFGNKIHFGDASRLDLLRSAGAGQAAAFVLAIDDVEASLRTAQMVRTHYPELVIYARARNRVHAYRLMDLGVRHLVRETFHSSLVLTQDVLRGLGFSAAEADETVQRFREHDEALLERQHKVHHDEAQLIASARQGAAELERLFEQDSRAADRPAE